jgi:ribonuclease R
LALQGREGEVFDAVVSGVAEFGFWVELAGIPVDGMVRLATLSEFWSFDATRHELLGTRSGRRIGLGERLQVALVEANLARAELNFTLAHEGPRTASSRPRPQGPKGPRPKRKTPRRRRR